MVPSPSPLTATKSIDIEMGAQNEQDPGSDIVMQDDGNQLSVSKVPSEVGIEMSIEAPGMDSSARGKDEPVDEEKLKKQPLTTRSSAEAGEAKPANDNEDKNEGSKKARKNRKMNKSKNRAILADPEKIIESVLSKSEFNVPNLSHLVVEKFNNPDHREELSQVLGDIQYEDFVGSGRQRDSVLPSAFDSSACTINLEPSAITTLSCINEVPEKRRRSRKPKNKQKSGNNPGAKGGKPGSKLRQGNEKTTANVKTSGAVKTSDSVRTVDKITAGSEKTIGSQRQASKQGRGGHLDGAGHGNQFSGGGGGGGGGRGSNGNHHHRSKSNRFPIEQWSNNNRARFNPHQQHPQEEPQSKRAQRAQRWAHQQHQQHQANNEQSQDSQSLNLNQSGQSASSRHQRARTFYRKTD